MKAIYWIPVALLIMIALAIFEYNSLKSTSDKLTNHIEAIEKNVDAGDWESAHKELNEAEKTWDDSKSGWAMLIEHLEIDNIDAAMERSSTYIDTKNEPLLMGELAVLRLYIAHIPEKESFLIENIL